MLISLLFLFVICSGSFFASVWYKKKFEDVFPITIMSMILILFLLGIINLLHLCTYIIIAITIILYLVTFYKLIKSKEFKDVCSNFFSVGSILFFTSYIVLNFLNRGRLANSWDEFSHWVDVVKAMFYVNDFNTNPMANSAFQSYPPGMSLFQYFMQKVAQIVHPSFEFIEWRIYLCYQIFFIAVLLPFFNKIKFNQPIQFLLMSVIVFLAPLSFFKGIYTTVYIDPILGILSGAALAAIFIQSEKNLLYDMYIWLICCMLILMKDVGFVFSIFIMFGYSFDIIYNCLKSKQINIWIGIKRITISIILPLFIKWLWNNEIITSGVEVSFNGNIDLNNLISVILGKDVSYRTDVLKNYFNALNTQIFKFGYFEVELTYIWLFIVYLVISFLIWKVVCYLNRDSFCQKTILIIQIFQCIAYVLGMCIMYMYKFSEYESLILASFSRYLNIVFLSGWMMFLLVSAYIISEIFTKHNISEIVMLVAIISCIPLQELNSIIMTSKQQASTIRAPYNYIQQTVNTICDGDDRIYIVSQENTGFDYWVCRFNVRPNTTNPNFTWSIGEPFYEGDIWTTTTTVEEWQIELIENYDYVLLYRINDFFLEKFSAIFENTEEISRNHLYWVNKSTGLLELCSE